MEHVLLGGKKQTSNQKKEYKETNINETKTHIVAMAIGRARTSCFNIAIDELWLRAKDKAGSEVGGLEDPGAGLGWKETRRKVYGGGVGWEEEEEERSRGRREQGKGGTEREREDLKKEGRKGGKEKKSRWLVKSADFSIWCPH